MALEKIVDYCTKYAGQSKHRIDVPQYPMYYITLGDMLPYVSFCPMFHITPCNITAFFHILPKKYYRYQKYRPSVPRYQTYVVYFK